MGRGTITCLRRLALLALLLTATVSLGSPTQAAPADGAAAGASACHPSPTSYISNQGTVGLGVINDWRGTGNRYTRGLYDAILPVGQRTDCYLGWGQAEGYYIGSGFCAVLKYYDRGWITHSSVTAGQRALPAWPGSASVHRWEVNPVHLLIFTAARARAQDSAVT